MCGGREVGVPGVDVEACFSESYAEAREKFLGERMGAWLNTLAVFLLLVLSGVATLADGPPRSDSLPSPRPKPDPGPAFADRLALVEHLRAGELDELEQLLLDLQRAYQAREIPENRVETAYLAFANSSFDLEEALGQWVERARESYAPRLARGVYYWNLGMLARGARRNTEPLGERYVETRAYFARATADLANALGLQPGLGMAYGLIIHIATELGDTSDILELTRMGLTADPGSFVVRRRYLDSLRPWWQKRAADREHAFERIDAFIDEMSTEFEENPDLRMLAGYPDFVRGDQLARNGSREAAIEHYNRALEFGPYWAYLYRRGVNYYRLGRFKSALRDLDSALRARPQAGDILNMRARTLHRLRRANEAFSDWKQALALNPFDPLILLQRAYALRDQRRFEAAVAELNKAMEFGTFNEYIWDARGRVYLYDLNDFNKAVRDLRRATELNPQRKKYWFNYGVALYKARDCKALPVLQHFLELCRSAQCPDQNLAWVQGILGSINDPGACPDHAP